MLPAARWLLDSLIDGARPKRSVDARMCRASASENTNIIICGLLALTGYYLLADYMLVRLAREWLECEACAIACK